MKIFQKIVSVFAFVKRYIDRTRLEGFMKYRYELITAGLIVLLLILIAGTGSAIRALLQ